MELYSRVRIRKMYVFVLNAYTCEFVIFGTNLVHLLSIYKLLDMLIYIFCSGFPSGSEKRDDDLHRQFVYLVSVRTACYFY